MEILKRDKNGVRRDEYGMKIDKFGQEYMYEGEHEANQEKLEKLQSELVKLRSRFFGTAIASEENEYKKYGEDFLQEQDLMRICFLNGAREAGFSVHQASFMFKYIFQFVLMVRRENYDIIRGKIIVPKSRKDETEKETGKTEKEKGKDDIKTVLKEILQRIEKTPEEDRADRERKEEKSREREARLSLERKGQYLSTDSGDVW